MQFDPKQLIYQPAKYQITVPGILDANWLDWFDDLTVTVEVIEEMEIAVSRISVVFDQAGLHGLLRRLYAYGLPIISVIWTQGD